MNIKHKGTKVKFINDKDAEQNKINTVLHNLRIDYRNITTDLLKLLVLIRDRLLKDKVLFEHFENKIFNNGLAIGFKANYFIYLINFDCHYIYLNRKACAEENDNTITIIKTYSIIEYMNKYTSAVEQLRTDLLYEIKNANEPLISKEDI